MKYKVYVLLSERDGGIYVGHTEDLELALHEHNSGAKRDTKYRLPIVLIHEEAVKSFKQVKMRERYWQSRQGEKEIESWIGKLPHPYEKDKRNKRV